MHKRNESGDTTLIVRAGLEVGKDQFLKAVDLVQEPTEFSDGLETLIRITTISTELDIHALYCLEGNIFLYDALVNGKGFHYRIRKGHLVR